MKVADADVDRKINNLGRTNIDIQDIKVIVTTMNRRVNNLDTTMNLIVADVDKSADNQSIITNIRVADIDVNKSS